MKVTTNLVTPATRLTPYVIGGLWLITAAVAGTSVWMSQRAAEVRAQIPLMEQQLNRINSRMGARVPRPMVTNTALLTLKRDIAFLNRLPEKGAVAFLASLQELERLLPPQVALVDLNYQREGGGLVLKAEAPHADELAAFLDGLQKDKSFVQVLLTNRSERVQQGVKLVQFELRVTQRKT